MELVTNEVERLVENSDAEYKGYENPSVLQVLRLSPDLAGWARNCVSEYASTSNMLYLRAVLTLLIKVPERSELLLEILELAIDCLPHEKLRNIVEWMFQNYDCFAALTSSGSANLALLRICTSILHRFDPQLDSKIAGETIALVASLVGFAHPSRLNKRGRRSTDRAGSVEPEEFTSLSVHVEDEEDKVPNDGSHESGVELEETRGPQRELELLESESMPNFRPEVVVRRAGDAIRRLRRIPWSPEEDGSAKDVEDVDLTGVSWQQLNNAAVTVCLLQFIFNLRRLNGTKYANLEEKIASHIEAARQILLARAPRSAALMDTCLDTEAAWEKWKAAECPPIKSTAEWPKLPPPGKDVDATLDRNLGPAVIGNTVLTRIMQTEIPSFDQHWDWKTMAKELHQENHGFRAFRCEPWSSVSAHFRETPVNQNAYVTEMENKQLEEERAERQRTEERTKRELEERERAESHKRVRYEDDRRYDRAPDRTASERTARTLPY